ncbi:hypothetical protein [Phenylobacterium sp.]|uniref:hypothetical protein n=1 Tax=Phenylobacterium sp. TaxID=1871053 RepID=UPI0035B1536C
MAARAGIIIGLALAAAAGPTLAGECGCRGDYEAQDRYGPPHAYQERAYREPYDRQPAPPCLEACGGEVSLPASFFAGAGGVGPVPAGGFYGGGVYVVTFGRAQSGVRAGARAFAWSSASTRASVSVSGGGRGGCCH